MTTLSFRLPAQLAPGHDSFDTRASAVQQWVEQLPMGHTGETARRLYEMIYEVNRLQITPTERFELLAAIEAALESILDNLERHYTGMPFPLQAKSIRVAQFSNQLLLEVITTYHATLDSEENASWLFRMTHTHMWVVCVHRLIYYLNRLLGNYRHIHRPAPAGLWQANHQLYLMARQHKRLQEKVTAPGGRGSSIEEEYKRSLLHSMIEPQLFRRSQHEELQATMKVWAGMTRLLESRQRPEGLVSYCIRIDHDEPHTLLSDSCCDACDSAQLGFLFDMSQLNQTLSGLLDRMGSDNSVRLDDGVHVLSRETLETLMISWRLPETVRHERIKDRHMVEVAIGMSVVHALLRGKEGARGISDQVMNEGLEELSILPVQREEKGQLWQQASTSQGKGRDVWESIFYATEVSQKAWAVETEEREIKFTPALQINYNETGYGIFIERNVCEPVQVGELIGFRSTPADAVELCVTRWLNESNKAITLGLKRLAATVEAVLMVIHTEQRRTPLYCLLGIGEDQVPLLFIPYLPNIRDKKLFLVVDKKEVPITLHDRVTLSPLFEAYHFAAAAGMKNAASTEEAMTMDELNQRMHEITQGRTRRKATGDEDFSDLWHSL